MFQRRALTVVLWFLCLAWLIPCRAVDYFIVIDTSGSMSGAISRKDTRPRLPVVKEALNDFIDSVAPGSVITLIPFSTGISQIRTITIASDSDKQEAKHIVAELKASGATWLWRTLDEALRMASDSIRDHPDRPLVVWALTDGEDSLGETTLAKVLAKYPRVNSERVTKSLVLLGDVRLELSAADKAAAKAANMIVTANPDFTTLMPPIIEVRPNIARVGMELILSERSGSRYKLYEWYVNDAKVSLQPEAKITFASPGKQKIRLAVVGSDGQRNAAYLEISVLEKERVPLKPEIWASKTTAEVGERISFDVKTTTPPTRVRWLAGEKVIAETQRCSMAFTDVAKFNVVAEVTDERGVTERSPSLPIEIADPKAAVAFRVLKNEWKDGEELNFYNESTPNLVRFEWQFGDNTTANTRDAAHVYRNVDRQPKQLGSAKE